MLASQHHSEKPHVVVATATAIVVAVTVVGTTAKNHLCCFSMGWGGDSRERAQKSPRVAHLPP